MFFHINPDSAINRMLYDWVFTAQSKILMSYIYSYGFTKCFFCGDFFSAIKQTSKLVSLSYISLKVYTIFEIHQTPIIATLNEKIGRLLTALLVYCVSEYE